MITKSPSRYLIVMLLGLLLMGKAFGYYTTSDQNVVDRKTGDVVQLRGIGLGGWLLPEGYMWGLRKLDRPRQFEAAIEDLIGARNARKFWDLYYENFVTRDEVAQMKSWGVNTLRVPLLASMIQPREGQPSQAPYIYDEHDFAYIDRFVEWCEALEMGIIWDLHGAPGGQNAANISDSDGEARLWTEKDIYWPLTLDLWDTITKRYADKQCIVGYDLLNEPLLGRYEGVDPGLLRELYVLLTAKIRETDTLGIIFVEGDNWAQDFAPLEPLDWDEHLVLGFHSYPPTFTQNGLQRWDDLRQKYDVPLWHGETGEQDPPWELYKRSTEFLQQANVGWNWWTHKKFELSRQPWRIHRTEGFDKILAYWKGEGERPSRRKVKKWLFEQARLTNSESCEFLPGMVQSLVPLDPAPSIGKVPINAPIIRSFPETLIAEEGFAAVLEVEASGYPLEYAWYKDGILLDGQGDHRLKLHQFQAPEIPGSYSVRVKNSVATVSSGDCVVTAKAFAGQSIPHASGWKPEIDAVMEPQWMEVSPLILENLTSGQIDDEADLSAWSRGVWDDENLYLFVRVQDDKISTQSGVDYLRDGIEIYIDADNSKSDFYVEDEFQLRVVLNETGIYSDIGVPLSATTSIYEITENGYDLELALPWSKLNGLARAGQFLGLDIHVNDSDSVTRNAKIAWHCKLDNAYRSPRNFGTLRLEGPSEK